MLVKVEAVSLNHRDLLILEGRLGYEHLPPLRPGSEFAGRVVEIGQGVTRFRAGAT
ncbi:MAG: alcohol dehydrogenase catalytic domain-containing protein [Acidobacteriota bacterium]